MTEVFETTIIIIKNVFVYRPTQYFVQNDVTPLDEYVQGDDGYWSYEYLATYAYNGVDIYVVNMTSQKYQDGLFKTI